MGILNSMSESLNQKKNATQNFNTQTPPLSQQNTMAANVANNLNSDSLLMKSAAARGERIAAGRGLQNTTLGAEASQRAMIDAAMPIAQIDTEHNHQRGMAQLQSDLSYSNQSRLNEAQNKFVASQAGLDRAHQGDMTRLNAQLNYDNQRRLNEAQNTFSASQAGLEREHQKSMTQLAHNNAMKELGAQVSANTIGKSIDFTMQITNNFDAQIAAVLNNTQMKEDDKKRAIEQLKASRDSELNFMSRFMQHIPTTQKDWANFPSLGVPTITMQ
ncbi:hypothetical protein ACFGYY_06510 [Pasteurella multocida]